MACCSSEVCLGMCDWTDCPGIETSTSLRQEDLVDFVAVNKAKNTVKKTRSDMITWKRWCDSISEQRSMEDIPTAELESFWDTCYESAQAEWRRI